MLATGLEPNYAAGSAFRVGSDHLGLGSARIILLGAIVVKPAILVLLLSCAACSTEASDPADARVAQHALVSVSATPYYVEFRARPSLVTGHTYLVYGALGKDGKPAEENVVGFTPEGGPFGLILGMIAWPGDVGRDVLDERLPDYNMYRRYLTAAQYQHLVAFVADEQKQTKVWNMFVNNCNDFAADAAQAIGLKVPGDRFVPPPLFVLMLSNMNT